MSLKNFLLLESTLAEIASGDAVHIVGSEGHHGARVMRLKPGESILVTDSHGFQAVGVVTDVEKASFRVELTSAPQFSAPRVPRLTLVQALAKGGRDEQSIETATELGVDSVVPWQAQRSIVQWKGEKAAKGRERWQATIRAAVKQSRRSTIPQVGAVVDSPSLGRMIADLDDSSWVLVLHESAETGLSEILANTNSLAKAERVVVVVGPEGGIADDECAAFAEAGAHVVRLGEEILRASSAGPAVIAALSAHLGRW